MLVERLRDVVCDSGADVSECSVDVIGQSAHSSSCGEGNQSYDERVLDQVLTVFSFRTCNITESFKNLFFI